MPRLSLALLLLCGATACFEFKDGAAGDDSGLPSADDTGAGGGGLDNIRALRQGAHSEGDTVTVEGVVLGEQLEIGMFIAERGGDPWSGVWIYAPNDFQGLTEGTRVRVTGVYEEYSQEGQGTLSELNLEDGGEITVLEQAALPAPTVLSVAQLSDPAQAEPYESMLVQVQDVRVTNPDLGFGEWELAGAILVDDYFFSPASLSQGELFVSVTGVLNFHYGAFKIEPRYPRDLVR